MPRWSPALIALTISCAKPAGEQAGPAPESQAEEAAIRAQETRWRDVIARKDVFGLRFQLATGSLENTAGVRNAKRELARVLTVARERGIDTDGIR